MRVENRAFTLGELKIISAANEEADQLEAELMDKIIETLEKRINAEAQVLHNHIRQFAHCWALLYGAAKAK
jgi:hypothetical protein